MNRAFLAAILVASLTGCMRSGPAEILETAKFEELQTNVDHARKLYREIVERYPDSKEAATARERLAALESGKPTN